MLGGSCSQCCDAPACIAVKPSGFAGSLLESPLFASYLNSDWSAYTTSTKRPFTINRGIYGTITVDGSIVRLTMNPYAPWKGNSSAELTFEDAVADALLAGDVVQLSTPIVNTISPDFDEYNKQLLASVGTFSLKLEKEACRCNQCDPGSFSQSPPASSAPETYTLEFTNKAKMPAGPRYSEQQLPANNAYSRHAGFLPLGEIRDLSPPQTLRSGCDSSMARFASPIVMRKVVGASGVYLSDPISIRPCTRARYQFSLCAISGNRFAAELYAFVEYYDGVSGQSGSPSSTVYAAFPTCAWDAAAYAADPQSFATHLYSHVYDFGGFAKVSPGGAYAPEQQLLCGGTVNDRYSLAEGCSGQKCPPAELVAQVSGASGSLSFLNGTYSLSITSPACENRPYGTNQNFFGGRRPLYGGSVLKQLDPFLSARVGVSLSRSFVPRNTFTGVGADDNCGCEGRPYIASISYLYYRDDPLIPIGGGQSIPKADDALTCGLICAASGTTLTWASMTVFEGGAGGTMSWALGPLTITVP